MKSNGITFADLIPAKGERAFFTGVTGSGKSKLAQYLLHDFDSVLIHDGKNDTHWPGYQRYRRLASLIAARPRRAIYAPKIDELDDPDMQDAFFKYAFLRRNVLVYVDELYLVTEGNTIPRHLKACITQGRSLGISTWFASQRPVSVPQWCLSESEWKFIFYLELNQDRKRVREVIGLEEEAIAALDPDQHEFFVRYRKRREIVKTRLEGVR